MNKYHNKKVTYDGITFDSNKEAEFYKYLKMLERIGKIKDLELQKVYELQPSYKLGQSRKQTRITYIADFTFFSLVDNKIHVVDVKGFKTDVYRLKRKLFEYKYQIELEEI